MDKESREMMKDEGGGARDVRREGERDRRKQRAPLSK